MGRSLAVFMLLNFTAASLRAQSTSTDPLVLVSGPSPFASCVADNPMGQAGTLYPNAELEPRLAVDPKNPRHLVGSFQQDRWSDGAARGLVAAVSFDGGASWRRSVVPGLTLCSGGPFYRASDPWVSFAPNGDVYHIALATAGARSVLLLNRSMDGGLTWQAPVTLVDESTGALHDKESVTADPTDAASHLVYAAWDRYDDTTGRVDSPAMFTPSRDGGEAWDPARVIYDPGLGSQTVGHQVLVLPGGALVDFFSEFRSVANTSPTQYEVSLVFLRSTDKGVTWSGPDGGPYRALRIYPHGTTTRDTARPVRTGDGLVDVAVDPASGRLYAAWQDARFTGSLDTIALAQSSDAGAHWSEPIRVSRAPSSLPLESQQAFTPTVRVSADGTIAVTYYDFRNDDPLAPGSFADYWAVRCRPFGAVTCLHPGDWNRETRLTDVSFDIEKAPFARGYFVGDYEGLGAAGTDFLAFFSQPHGDDPASIFFRRIRP
jgi:hypothetical protein